MDTERKWLIFFMHSSIVFLICYLVQAVIFFNVIWSPDVFWREITREEWYWYLDEYWHQANVVLDIYALVRVRNAINVLFGLVTLRAIFYVVKNKKWAQAIGGKLMVGMAVVGVIVSVCCFLYFKYEAEHYRLFMGSTYSAISAVMLLTATGKVAAINRKQSVPGDSQHIDVK